MNVGDRVTYQPVTRRRGVLQAPKPSDVLSIYDDGSVRIRCEGEKRDRRVRDVMLTSQAGLSILEVII